MVGKSSVASSASELDEQVEDLVEHLVGPGVGAVDLVDDDDRPQAALEGLAQHEARLRHAAPRRRRPAAGTPSAILRTRSTSPPKSAWPGVSMMLILTCRRSREWRCSWPGW